MRRTVEVVPSPMMSSCAVQALAMRLAVGCWICCTQLKLLEAYADRHYSETFTILAK